MRGKKGQIEQQARDAGKPVDALLREALTKGGSISGAADLLNVRPQSISYWIKRFGWNVTFPASVQIEEAQS